MTSVIRHLTVGCADPYVLAGFWAAALGGSLAEDDFPGDPEATVTAGAHALLFVAVEEERAVKNGLHLDLQPQDRTRDEEVDRLIALDATLHEDHRNPDGTGWVTLLDPGGHAFCVERGAAERAAG
ncbi:VOC family protein [Streptomyces sp. AM 2-1-1]|uniref:VOC family protein n=1 Tax=Streptomyces sp. AM 2-1-1 TaxID=3028709 RepID=UPI0023B8EC1E|nr:VOC family protein [Streptomyces sp. AM 2-1-1]WEH40620.1 VOC family protein [Streptomyces sp. AM 2-1-1]